MIVWPEVLPQHFLRQGNSEGFGDGVIASSNSAGPPKVRPRSSAMPRPFSASMRMNETQLEAFIVFFTETLLQASLPFVIPRTRGAGTWLVQFAPGSRPAWNEIGGSRWNVSMPLTILRDIAP